MPKRGNAHDKPLGYRVTTDKGITWEVVEKEVKDKHGNISTRKGWAMLNAKGRKPSKHASVSKSLLKKGGRPEHLRWTGDALEVLDDIERHHDEKRAELDVMRARLEALATHSKRVTGPMIIASDYHDGAKYDYYRDHINARNPKKSRKLRTPIQDLSLQKATLTRKRNIAMKKGDDGKAAQLQQAIDDVSADIAAARGY